MTNILFEQLPIIFSSQQNFSLIGSNTIARPQFTAVFYDSMQAAKLEDHALSPYFNSTISPKDRALLPVRVL